MRRSIRVAAMGRACSKFRSSSKGLARRGRKPVKQLWSRRWRRPLRILLTATRLHSTASRMIGIALDPAPAKRLEAQYDLDCGDRLRSRIWTSWTPLLVEISVYVGYRQLHAWTRKLQVAVLMISIKTLAAERWGAVTRSAREPTKHHHRPLGWTDKPWQRNQKTAKSSGKPKPSFVSRSRSSSTYIGMIARRFLVKEIAGVDPNNGELLGVILT